MSWADAVEHSLDSLDDRALMERHKAGDPDAFGEIFRLAMFNLDGNKLASRGPAKKPEALPRALPGGKKPARPAES